MTKINPAYFNPFSDQFHALDDFKKLNNFQKVVTVVGTFFASLFTLGTFSVCSFRLLVGRFSSKVNSVSADNTNQVSQRVLGNQTNDTTNNIQKPSPTTQEIPQSMNELINSITDEDVRNSTENLKTNLKALMHPDNNPVVVKIALEKFLVKIEHLLNGSEEEKDGLHSVLLILGDFQGKQYEKLAFGLLEDYSNDPNLEVGNNSNLDNGSWSWVCANALLKILKNSKEKDEYLKKFINRAFENQQYSRALVLLDDFSSDETRNEFALEKAKLLNDRDSDNWLKIIRADYKPKNDLILSILKTKSQMLKDDNSSQELEQIFNNIKLLGIDSATEKEIRQLLGLPN